jgi:hypothetical protein
MTNTAEKIAVGIDSEVVELEGSALTEFVKQRKVEHDHYLSTVADREAKATAKAALLERLGITAEEAILLLS